MLKTTTLVLFAFLVSCARSPLKKVEEAMRAAQSRPLLVDSLSKESFFSALKKHIAVMKTSKLVYDPMVFGERRIEKAKYIKALEQILEHESKDDWSEWINKNFDFFEVYGRGDWGIVMATGYYEPKVKGSRTKSETFSRPVYATPNDLVRINLNAFSGKFPKWSRPGSLQGRLVNQTVLPYYTRQEIDGEFKLKNQNLELAWLDPIDAFFIQIQGSGLIEFDDGEKMRIGYDDQNGHTYESIGKFLTHAIPLEKMSMQKIKAHLKTLSSSEQQDIMNKNPSYVFFKKLDGEALTYAGMEVSEGRTIATDKILFPKGALAFLDIEIPTFKNADDQEPISWKRSSRLVFDEDTGGAIRGADRVDLYMGQGEKAAQMAGVMKRTGRLYYLVPR
ncbi:MAG: murein transglycosylase A [Bacteriovorax sp.]